MNVFDAKTLFDEVKKVSYSPNRWEKKFLKSISEQLGQGIKLSEKQGKCLEAIYCKATINKGA